jgi:hypothetical protein
MNISVAEISSIVQARRETPYLNASAALPNPAGFTATSQTFRIEAVGLIDDRPRASVTAVVQKRNVAGGAAIAIVEWSGVR